MSDELAYEPKLIFYQERGEFEYVTEDTAAITDGLAPHYEDHAVILDMTTRKPMGFSVSLASVAAALAEAGFVIVPA